MDWIDSFVHDFGALLGKRRAQPVTLELSSPPRVIAGAIAGNTLATTREGMFWMLAANEIMTRIDQQKAQDKQHGYSTNTTTPAQLELIPDRGDEPQPQRNPYRTEGAGNENGKGASRRYAGSTRGNRKGV
jgi:hypothetical protein